MEDIEKARVAYLSRKPWVPAYKYRTFDKIKNNHHSIEATSEIFQPIELHPLNPSEEIPTHFIACSIVGTDIPAIEEVDLSDKNLLLNIDLGGAADINQVGGFWGLAQKATISMMQLKYMYQDKNLRSITISLPIPFPESLKQYLKEFTGEHFPEKPVFTAIIPDNTIMISELSKSSSVNPLLVKLNSYTKIKNLNSTGLSTTAPVSSELEKKSFIQKIQPKNLKCSYELQ